MRSHAPSDSRQPASRHSSAPCPSQENHRRQFQTQFDVGHHNALLVSIPKLAALLSLRRVGPIEDPQDDRSTRQTHQPAVWPDLKGAEVFFLLRDQALCPPTWVSTDGLELTTVTFISSLVVNVALCCLESGARQGVSKMKKTSRVGRPMQKPICRPRQRVEKTIARLFAKRRTRAGDFFRYSDGEPEGTDLSACN